MLALELELWLGRELGLGLELEFELELTLALVLGLVGLVIVCGILVILSCTVKFNYKTKYGAGSS